MISLPKINELLAGTASFVVLTQENLSFA